VDTGQENSDDKLGEAATPGAELRQQGPIFVVDDEEAVVEVMEALLELHGVTASFFTDPVIALEAFIAAEPKPRLLISDYQMPKMNGMELLQMCKAEHPGLRSISCSGTLNVDEMRKYSIQPDRRMAKPFRSQQLFALLDELLA